jgi:hypothetical protein
MKFREECLLDVQVFYQPAAQTSIDPNSGETITASEDNELLQGVTGVIWSEKHASMTSSCDKSISSDVLSLRNMA